MAINNPRDIPGLVAWYSAQAETGYADGSGMPQWTDLSGNGNHAVGTGDFSSKPTWRATAGPNGGPAVYFSGGAQQVWFALPSGILTGSTAGEIAVSIKSGGGDTSHWSFGEFPGSSDQNHYPYAGTVYESFGLPTGNRQSFTPSLAITSWRRYSVSAAVGAFRVALDGVSQLTSSPSAIAWASQPWLGRGRSGGGGGMVFNGHVAAVVLYSRALTTTERADLDAWLAANPNGGTASAPTAPILNLAGFAPTVAGAFEAASTIAPIDADLVGVAPAVDGSFVADVPGVVAADLAGSAPAVFGAFSSSYAAAIVATATTYANDGYNYDGVADVDEEPPVAATPAHLPREKVKRVHQSMPAPTLVNGRPT